MSKCPMCGYWAFNGYECLDCGYRPRRRHAYPSMVPLLAVLALGCATTITEFGIAADLDASLRTTTPATENVLAIRCGAVYRAEERCLAAGFKADCAWNTWHERDHDSTVAMCLARKEE